MTVLNAHPHHMRPEDVVNDFSNAQSDERQWIYLSRQLLILASDQSEQIPPELEERVARFRDEAARSVAECLPPPSFVDSFVHDEDIVALTAGLRIARERLRNAASEANPTIPDHLVEACLANATARSIDQFLNEGEQFLDWFPGIPSIQRNDVFPHLVRDIRNALGDLAPNSDPANTPRGLGLDRTGKIGLRRQPGMTVRMHCDLRRLAPTFNRMEPLRMAALQPNLTLGEFNVEYFEREGRLYYANNGPRDLELQTNLLADLIATASSGEHCADICVGGEYAYSADPERIKELVTRIGTALNRPELVVVGVAAQADPFGTPPQDCAAVIFPNAPVKLVPKVFPAPIVRSEDSKSGSDPSSGNRVRREEFIRSGTELHVIVTPAWSIAILVCRDAFDGPIIDTLVEFGVNLVLVPAMTPKVGSAVENLGRAVSRSQALVCITASPRFWVEGTETPVHPTHRTEAVFHGPYEHYGPTRLPDESTAEGTEPDARTAWIFDSSTRHHSRIVHGQATIDN